MRAVFGNAAHGRPVAVHIEAQSMSWLEEKPTHHGRLCADILGGPLMSDHDRRWDSGLVDAKPFPTGNVMSILRHPAVRVVSISTCYPENEMPIGAMPESGEIDWPLIMRAVGNHGTNWNKRRKHDCLTGLHILPTYVRVGESADGCTAVPESQSSGPAFVCGHPFHISRDYGYILHPTQDEIDRFLDHARAAGHGCSPMMESFSAGNKKYRKTGTSFSAPHAGAMIMKHTAGMAGISSGDILPAVLMAARDNPVARRGGIVNAAGFHFDQEKTGFGFLKEEALARRLAQMSAYRGKSTAASSIETTTVDGVYRFVTAGMRGPVVNVAITARFRAKCEDDVPSHIRVRSPSGTEISLPMLLERARGEKTQGLMRAGFQTAAFFGEENRGGEWTIECPRRIWGRYAIADARIHIHGVHQDSPGARMMRG